ncbi:unnamed protein product [Thelazia callipaeda]|uniref:Uncharacterized protein n=1 Tax=Thelazia callipaeda TaxID=103827 RepID=A0A0N5CZQ1_THECL|nr:unnamed protein product [Thelazia callipaeda]
MNTFFSNASNSALSSATMNSSPSSVSVSASAVRVRRRKSTSPSSPENKQSEEHCEAKRFRSTSNQDQGNATNTSKNNAYSIIRLLEKKELSSSRASSSTASDDDNAPTSRCQSTDDDEGNRFTELAELGRAVTWPHFFAAGPSAFAVPHAVASLRDSSTIANAVAAAAAVTAAGQDLSQVQQLQNAYLSYILGTSMTATSTPPVVPQHHPMRLMVTASDNSSFLKFNPIYIFNLIRSIPFILTS